MYKPDRAGPGGRRVGPGLGFSGPWTPLIRGVSIVTLDIAGKKEISVKGFHARRAENSVRFPRRSSGVGGGGKGPESMR